MYVGIIVAVRETIKVVVADVVDAAMNRDVEWHSWSTIHPQMVIRHLR
jgi:hypothetical protein